MSADAPTEEFGPYLVYEQLGIGGMAQVHRAVSATSVFPQPVALKRMLSHIATSEEMVKSFVREARLASYLKHKNVAQTHDLGRVGDVYFIEMELITGRNLREVLRHCGVTTGPMPVPIALNILNQVCDALDYAHNLCDETGRPLGIIHRDVSPSNVIVSDEGVVKLIDFGIAKAQAPGMQTMSGTLKGKFAYIAPEYINGQLDARADLFAVGVIAHELLTNRPLFSGRDDIDTLTRVRDMHVEPPSAKNSLVPLEIDDIVMTALARDPEKRWQHATALRSALTTLTGRLGLVATNRQVVEWLDWAFTQTRKRRTDEHDTESDGPPVDEPSVDLSVSGEACTAERVEQTQITLMPGDGVPEPVTQTPVGTPVSVPIQPELPVRNGRRRTAELPMVVAVRPVNVERSRPVEVASSGMALGSERRRAPGVPVPPALGEERRRTMSGSSTGMTLPFARSSEPQLVRRPSGSAPPIEPLPQALPAGTVPVPVVMPIVTLPPPVPLIAPQVAARMQPGSVGSAALAGAASCPLAGLKPAPFSAPKPTGVLHAPPCDPARSEELKREFEQRASAPWSSPASKPRTRRLPVVGIVAVAAAIAAVTTYFVLPLLF